MSSIILPYSQSIVESFYRPAIVKPQNIMKVKSFDLDEVSSMTATEWVLCRFRGTDHERWMTKASSELIKYDHDIIKRLPVDMKSNREIDITVRLMQAAPGSAVIWGIPYDMQRMPTWRK